MKDKFILVLLICAWSALAGAEQTRFVAMDVFIDPKGEALAAYQLEIAAPGGCKIVGIEGGEHPEFRKAPYYDPKGMQRERLIVAAFSTAANANLPNARSRILTLHLECLGNQTPKLEATLKLSANPSGAKFNSDLTLTERKQP
jgi:hypothetical protein